MEAWESLLAAALVLNALLGFGYRLFRFYKGGPLGDVIGQAVLGALLVGLAVAVGTGAGWARWAALAYGLLFGLLVMPIWTLAVLLPLRPTRLDYVFTATYWGALAGVVVAAIAL
ncbi:MAG: hypothetical protein M3285_08580 [Actinomycetota bacterium]|nr:hypothetical protein [Actinomycetota bacterium]